MSISKNIIQFKKSIPGHIQLVAVSKTKSNDEIKEAYNTGHSILGENKVQELTKKYEELPKDIQWHFIGHLQRNKVKYIVPFVTMIHSVDSMRLLKMINKEAGKVNRKIDCLLQMHIAQESTKFGLELNEIKDILNSDVFEGFQNVTIRGLMGMATFTDDEQIIRNEFKYIRSCFEKIKETFFMNSESFNELSIGMSNDYHIAIEEGSTILRIGSLIFGERNY